ncbi:chemotaxis protein CheB [Roseibium aestuarii]|uniref:protein-glutamate methylesterase n=1 Tax=Roseibium aestuarii TaxID=2600299 RepID=A0ABW4JYR8_9HYPH|nr:chemotaxis protein CheB [Roseibium aestuarii]
MSDLTPSAVIIGASAGALDALTEILPALPADYPLPVFVVVHVPPDKRSVLADIFAARCALPVIEAEDKEPVQSGVIYFAPPNYHLLLEDTGSIALTTEEEVLFSRPSIDVAFESAAEAWGSNLIGVVLTGANHDGSRGLATILRGGGTALVQTPEGAYARAMPEAAIAACPQAKVLSLSGITDYLLSAPR